MLRQSLSLLTVLLTAVLPAQQSGRALTHDDYDQWKSISGRAIRRDGEWVALSVAPQRGDAELLVRRTTGDTEYRYACGTGPKFSPDGRFVVFRIEPTFAEKRQKELEKLKKAKERRESGESSPRGAAGGRRGRGARGGGGARGPRGDADTDDDAPKPKYGVMNLESGAVEVLENVKGFQMPDEGPAFLVYQLEREPDSDSEESQGEETEAPRRRGRRGRGGRAKPEGAKPEGEATEKKKDEKTPKHRKDGDPLVVRNLTSGDETRIEGVVTYGLTKKTGWLWFACNAKQDDPKVELGLFALHLDSGRRVKLAAGAGDYKGFRTDKEETRFAFYSNLSDVTAKKPRFDIYTWDFEAKAAKRAITSARADFPKDRRVADGYALRFSRDGSVLMFGADPQPREDLPDILADEKVMLDLWHWKDPLLQPMQAKQGAQMSSETLAQAWHFDAERIVGLTRSPFESASFLTEDGTYALARDGQRYAHRVSWDGRYTDVAVVNTLDGTRRAVLTELRGSPQPSPTGRFLLHWHEPHWHCTDLVSGETHNLTEGLDVPFAREEHDTPQPARAHGVAGWTAADGEVVLYDRFDLWRIKPDGSEAVCVTEGFGRANDLTLRWVRLDRDAPSGRGSGRRGRGRRSGGGGGSDDPDILPTDEPILLSARNVETMATGYYHDRLDGMAKPKQIVMKDAAFGGLAKAKDADRLFFSMTTFRQCADLYTSTAEFTDVSRLTDINPQQKDYRWGTAELVRWHSLDGIPLKGVLVKPDGFDPSKEYPLMVYFYERRSQSLHSYVTPRPTTSPVASYYVSNGYLWFEPDIVYREGYPGESCLKCVVPGVQHLVAKGFVDNDAIGAAGHSWGGYQTAYLITRTNIFKAVESGAPVSNMTSAYGGIRWGSGMSRAFQYEKTQSRIGGSLWEYPMRYIENSPLFAADKVQTPILMLHNDQDGAVPWYQGIEYFCALRRLGKECYMFNYVGADHGLRKRQNTSDWTVRMAQFFDHHLRGAPMPPWMRDGVPYHLREREKIEFNEPGSILELEQMSAASAAEASSGGENGGAR